MRESGTRFSRVWRLFGGRRAAGALLAVGLVASMQAPAQAAPIEAALCSSGMGLTCIASGNDSGVNGETNVETALFGALGMVFDIMAVTADVIIAPVDFTFDPTPINGGNTFAWTYTGAMQLAFATVKAGNEFAVFDIRGLNGGILTTVDVFLNNGTQIPDISHVRFWKIPRDTTSLPEPATLALFGIGLAGLGLARWRKSA